MEYNSTEQNLSWFYQRHRDGVLHLNPPFQRKPVWTKRQKAPLIESILLKYPIPEIYLQTRVSENGDEEYIVVDGQQRIRAVLEFIGDDQAGGFSLEYLESDSTWLHATFAGLSTEEKKTFFSYRFAVRSLATNSDEDVKSLFRRLNKYSVKLTAQELRNATYTGPFSKLSETLAEDSYWSEQKIVSTISIRRMGDIEFVSELLIGLLHGPQGGGPSVVDDYYSLYEEEFPEQASVRRLFDRTLEVVQSVYPDLSSVRWHNKTDFYSLFIALGHELKRSRPGVPIAAELPTVLGKFTEELEAWFPMRRGTPSESVRKYVTNVEKGANDKARRGARHQALIGILDPLFGPNDEVTRRRAR